MLEDFCLGGSIVHAWLPPVFRSAYADMTFKEFTEADQSTDVRLVETLSFHAVNGRRLKSSVEFLEDQDIRWRVQLLSVTMEPIRILIYYWLSCIGTSLKTGERPAVHKLIDPRTSLIVQALQHYSALLLSLDGDGRLNLIWNRTEFASYGDFCKSFSDKCRTIRRMLMLGSAWVYRRHFMYLNSDQFSATMCGDPDAHHDTLETFLQFWDAKHSCCFAPGLCRDLKLMNLSRDDLLSDNTKKFLYWIASTVQLSIADVEAMHSQNKSLEGVSFASIAAKYINSEAVRTQQEAAKLQFGKDGGAGGSKHKHSGARKANGITTCWEKKQPTAKGLSALEIFRKHFLELRSRTEKVNPCCKSLWQDVREAFGSLTPKEKHMYEMMSEDSKAQALCERMQRKAQEKNAGASNASAEEVIQPEPEAVVPANGHSPGVHLQILPMHELGQALGSCRGATLGNVIDQYAAKSKGSKDSKDIAKSDFPLGESTLDAVWKSQVASGVSGRDAFKTFTSQSESIARPNDSSDVFPDRVLHEGWCGEQCRHFGESKRVALHCHTLELFNFIVCQTLAQMSWFNPKETCYQCYLFSIPYRIMPYKTKVNHQHHNTLGPAGLFFCKIYNILIF